MQTKIAAWAQKSKSGLSDIDFINFVLLIFSREGFSYIYRFALTSGDKVDALIRALAIAAHVIAFASILCAVNIPLYGQYCGGYSGGS